MACLQGKYTPLFGVALLAEYEDVLRRDEIFTDTNLSLSERNDLLDDILSVSQWVQIFYLWRPNLIDESDNHLVELAVAGNASYIVSHNTKDFRQSQLSFDFKIITPEQLLGENNEYHHPTHKR